MNTLIAYATKHGSVQKCAGMLAERLSGTVDLLDLKNTGDTDLTKYDRVIIGGSIYAGRVQKTVTDFCIKNMDVLKTKKLGFFICCINSKAAPEELKMAYPQELADAARAKDSFGGELRVKEMNFMEKAISKMVSKMLAKEDKSMEFDLKQDVSLISSERISRFAELMNE